MSEVLFWALSLFDPWVWRAGSWAGSVSRSVDRWAARIVNVTHMKPVLNNRLATKSQPQIS